MSTVSPGLAMSNVPRLDSLITRVLYAVLFIGIFFPYLKVLPLGTDIQPTAMLAAIAITLASNARFPGILAPLFIVVAAALVFPVVMGFNMSAVRSIANYMSICFISIATYVMLKANGGISRSAIQATVIAWFVVGLVQLFLYPAFLTDLLSGFRTTSGRGVVALAPEPTAYGVHCLILLLLVRESFAGHRRAVLTGILLFQIVLLARSSMAILFLLVWVLLYVVVNFWSKRTLIAIMAAYAAGYGIRLAFERYAPQVAGIRAIELFRLIVADPSVILVRDQSVSERVSAIVYSVRAFLADWFLPHGFTSWAAYVRDIGPNMTRYLPYYSSSAGDRIMSGYGAALYELGFVGLVIPYVITRAARVCYGPNFKRFLVVVLFLHMLLWAAVPLGYPPLGFLIGYFCYRSTVRNEVASAVGSPSPLMSPAPFPSFS